MPTVRQQPIATETLSTHPRMNRIRDGLGLGVFPSLPTHQRWMKYMNSGFRLRFVLECANETDNKASFHMAAAVVDEGVDGGGTRWMDNGRLGLLMFVISFELSTAR